MKKISLLAVLFLTSACVTSNPQKSSSFGNVPAEGLTTETHGLLLEQKTTQRVALRIDKVSATAKFTQSVPTLPGENMRNAYQPATVAGSDDYIIGINGNLNWKTQDELLSALSEVYGKNSMIPMHVINAKTWKVQHVFISDGHSLNDLTLSSATLTMYVSAVKGVAPGSWAERRGLKNGDEIVGTVKFRSATIRRSGIPFLTYNRNETSTQETVAGNTPAVTDFLNTMFQSIKPYMPTKTNRAGIMGDVGLLRVTLIRGSALMPKDLSHSRYVGLGVLFDCQPYCGSARPVVKAMREDSAGGRSGIKLEDVAWSVNGKRVHNSWDTVRKIRKLNFGDSVVFRVMRNGNPVDITMKVEWVIED